MDCVDSVVVGAGVVGLACGRALAMAGRDIVVLERAQAIGTGVSSRNSEVIHSGLYYPPGSLKARLCVQGKDLLYGFCDSHGVPHRRCGKLVVATDEAQRATLQTLAQRAAANGVPVQILTAEEARAMEPTLQCLAALWSPSTGIVDSHALMSAIEGDLSAHGGAVALDSALVSARVVVDGFELRVRTGDGHEMALHTRELVNAAGLYACHVARAIEGFDATRVPMPRYAKGSYFTLGAQAPFSRLIYPAPQDAWLGVHLTLDMGGQARFGPDLEWLDLDDPGALDYQVNPARAEAFYAEVRRYWPGLPDGALQPGYSGVRPKIYGPGQPAPDFGVEGPADHGVPGLVQLWGIESPGLTSALALAEHTVGLLQSPV